WEDRGLCQNAGTAGTLAEVMRESALVREDVVRGAGRRARWCPGTGDARPRRSARTLGCLRTYWVERVRDIKGIDVLTPEEPARYGAVTSFRLPAMKDYAQAQRLARLLLEKHKVLTVARRGITAGSAVRVTPTLYNTREELDRFVGALRVESPAFL
ncbi:MAG: hypothetical protein ABL982_24720, partial [Vicinamibacterales bacterium]